MLSLSKQDREYPRTKCMQVNLRQALTDNYFTTSKQAH